jgi:hypothetical protein
MNYLPNRIQASEEFIPFINYAISHHGKNKLEISLSAVVKKQWWS